MALLLNWRVWVAIALAAALAFSHFFVYRAGKANVRADFDAYKLAVSETTRKLQAANELRATEQRDQQLKAQNDAKTREAGLRADAGSAVAELDRLRNALRVATRRDPVPGAAAAAADQPVATQAVVFLECAAAFTELARTADGHASDVETLEDSWPKK
jgi:hypothetical protein